jgi:Mrp family chromosome partitioning ATPase
MSTQPQTIRAEHVDAPAFLGAIQQAWSAQQPPAPPPPRVAEPAVSREPVAAPADSFLHLRQIPQIPLDSARDAFPMLSRDYPADWKDQIRQLRNRLCGAQGDLEAAHESLQILAFTNMDGARPRHGTATNLALAFASLQDTRVLVIDANLHAPSLHAGLHIPPGPGLCEATRYSREQLPTCFRRITGTQLYLLPAGDVAAHPMDPLDLRGLHSLLHSLRAQFDWILIDGPGFQAPADAIAVTMAADGVIMMIEQRQDSFRQVSRALSQVQGRRMLGAVMY